MHLTTICGWQPRRFVGINVDAVFSADARLPAFDGTNGDPVAQVGHLQNRSEQVNLERLMHRQVPYLQRHWEQVARAVGAEQRRMPHLQRHWEQAVPSWRGVWEAIQRQGHPRQRPPHPQHP